MEKCFFGQRPKIVRAGIMESTMVAVSIMEPSVGRTYIGRAYIKPGVMDMECMGKPRCVRVERLICGIVSHNDFHHGRTVLAVDNHRGSRTPCGVQGR